jgi:transcription-repair coupling factor (superfamily II helicase)
VLLVVDGPEPALDAIADLRAFLGLHEALQPQRAARRSVVQKLADEEHWADAPNSGSGRGEDGQRKFGGAGRAKGIPAVQIETMLFPAWDVLPTESDRPEGMTLADRRRTTDRLRDVRNGAAGLPQCLLIAAPMTALLQPAEAPGDDTSVIVLRTGADHDPIKLGRKLSDAGYERVGQVEVRGEFSLRGGILDVFPYTSDTPFRVDFLGDTIESIKPFDPISQRSDEVVESISFADASPDSLKKLFSPGATTGAFSLLDHLPDGALIVWQEPQKLRQHAELYRASLMSGRSICFELKQLLAQAAEKFDTLQLASWEEAVGEQQEPGDQNRDRKGAAEVRVQGSGFGVQGSDVEIDNSATRNPQSAIDSAKSEEPAANAEVPEYFVSLTESEPVPVACTTLQRVRGEIPANAEAWKKLLSEREQVVVFCETAGHRQRLSALFGEAKVAAPNLQLVLGKLSGGFDLRAAGLAVTSDREILGISRHALTGAAPASPKTRRHVPGTVAIQHLMDLQLGDYVVHAAHGIARYLGLARLEKSGRTEDYLTLLFNNDVKLYVPAAHVGWVSKYIGGHADLELSTLGSKVWARKKERAATAIRDIAEDLLKVQAVRRSLPGIVYPPDHEWQQTFEQAFPYEETVDQDSAILAIKRDMEGTCPMDRLLCGDVGFGKTEVALRAAFKAACSGKQVAVLTPTTLLSEQHGRTFKERFAGYPFSVEVLSRFRTPAEQDRILDKLATGRVDVVIGTHRLIQKDVRFKDLGLAVIDEEQRFGVEHKEFFKQLRKSVDVLTLTATPIPRTLHMALLGLRDISNLTTPPRNRRSIITKVARVSDDLLRRAILREISRGGQVFVVHPRVYDIQEFRIYLAGLVPEARFGVGHGQMDADDLEEVMGKFLHGKIDVLVSTTIVESGLDIPSANTILIHEADRFGLAELHQLRGRVGRSDVQAYCYLLLPEHSALTPEGLRRLRALEEFDELGAGFQLALKDLEIRGAGNVLGRQQSGEIAEIGYDLYCKLLESTVKDIRGEKMEEEIEVNLQLRGAAYIPETFVEDDKVVLELYRRLDAARTDEDVDALKAEMIDRFGPPPEPVLRMFEETKLRRLARMARVPYVGLDNEEGRIIFKLHGWDLKLMDRALRGLPEMKGVRILDGQTLSFAQTLRAKHDEATLRTAIYNLLEALALQKQRETAPAPGAEETRPRSRAAHA